MTENPRSNTISINYIFFATSKTKQNKKIEKKTCKVALKTMTSLFRTALNASKMLEYDFDATNLLLRFH